MGDGTSIATLKSKIEKLNIKEIAAHHEDKQVLKQASVNKDRVFICSNTERKLLASMLSGEQSLTDFIVKTKTSDKSENFRLIFSVCKRLQKSDIFELPDCYNSLFVDLINV